MSWVRFENHGGSSAQGLVACLQSQAEMHSVWLHVCSHGWKCTVAGCMSVVTGRSAQWLVACLHRALQSGAERVEYRCSAGLLLFPVFIWSVTPVHK